MSILRGHKVPTSSKVLLGLLASVSGLLLILKYQQYQVLVLSSTTTSDPVKFHDIKIPFLQLIPRSTIFNPWVLVLAIFAETSIFTFILSAGILLVGSKFTERFWGYFEVIKFIIIVGTITNLFTVVIAIISNIIREDAKNMDQPLGGGISYYFAFLVVFKQLIPEHNIVLFQGLVNFRVKHVPFALLIIFTFWSILISSSIYPAVPSLGSFLVSFFYLRFFQSLTTEPNLPLANNDASNSSIITGDASDTFQLIEFFPNVTKPVFTPVFNQVYEVSVLLGIVTPFNDESVEQSNLRAQKRQEQANQSHKNVANSVAERRRQVALQVIEDRINKETAAAASAAGTE